MRLQRITELVYHRPWLITPSGHEAIRAIIQRKLGVEMIETERAGLFDDLFTARPAPTIDDGGVATVHITGAIGIGLSKLEKTCGNTDLRDLLAEIRDVQAQGARKIMLLIDSPGGTVGGVPEAAAEIAGLKIPVFGYVPPGAMACSAAYYLASGADKIFASHSAEVGSIGVYLPWVDLTAAYEQMGYKVELITNNEGDLKGTGYPGTALSDAQRIDLQQGVQEIFDDFAAHVRATRPAPIADDTLRGQSFSARDAKKRRLIDDVASHESAMRALLRYQREA